MSAISAKLLPASAAALTASTFIPVTLTENRYIDFPKLEISVPNFATLLFPANQLITPPSLGTVSAISAKLLPASAAALTASTFIPVTLFENFFIFVPNDAISVPNFATLLSPANQLITPPSLGTVSDISAKAFAASADALTASTSIPATLSAYALSCGPNAASSSPKDANDEPPVSHDVRPERISAAVSIRTTPASTATPSRTDESIVLAPSMKGLALVIKSDKF